MKRKYFKSDFTIVESFVRQNGEGAFVAVPVPEHVKIEYFVDNGRDGAWVIERDGDHCSYCRLSDDGMFLICSIALSRKPIGTGPLMKRVTEFNSDPSFPHMVKRDVNPVPADVNLVCGQSDDDDVAVSSTIMLQLQYGYSAYQLALQEGFDGTLEEWIASLKGRPGDPGPQGGLLLPKFYITQGMHLHAEERWDSNRFRLQNGHLIAIITN